jgi:hypothetical protein
VTAALFVVGSCSTPSGDGEDLDQFRGDVLVCEEAFARLKRCCPTKPSPLNCDYSLLRSCDSGELVATYPDEGSSLLNLSCDAIVSGGHCSEETRPR